jgi:hypothetical protein
MDNSIGEKLIKYSNGIIKTDENICSDEYDLIYWSYFVPNDFNKKVINIIGEAGFDCEYEKDRFGFDYYPDEDMVIYKNHYYRTAIINEEVFTKYKDNVIFREETDVIASSIEYKDNLYSLPWIRYPRTKDGVLIPHLVEKIFQRIPSKIVFVKENS